MDLDWSQYQFHLTQLAQGHSCSVCPAGDGEMIWTDCRQPHAGNTWAASVWTNQSHGARYGNDRHRLLRVLPGFGVANYIPDILHVKRLGADQYCLGSVLALLTHYWLPGAPADNLKSVVEAIVVAYKVEGVESKDRYPNLKVTQYKPAKANILPKLKGTGMQCKGLGKVMPSVFEAFMDATDPLHHRVPSGLRGIQATNEIYDANRTAYRFPAADAERLIHWSFDIAQQVTALIRAYHPKAIVLFHYTIKQHYTLHAALSARYTNPCYGDWTSGEDLMKVAKL
jgi:hypothetical protein